VSRKTEEVKCSGVALDVEGCYLGLLTFSRPDQLEPISWSAIKTLRSLVETFAKDDTVRVVAITGDGTSYSAGAYFKAYLTLQCDEREFRGFLEDFHALLNFVPFDVPKPVIALGKGVSAAEGTEVWLASDFAYAAQSAGIGDAHLNFAQMEGVAF
jgi:enoyl-CoA hydratase/carnithine racemase